MGTRYSKDGLNAYQIKERNVDCPIAIPQGAKSMTTARITFENVQDDIIEWYEQNKL